MKKLLVLFLLTTPLYADISFTFDDGWKSQVQNAEPILAKYQERGTVYVVTSFVGTTQHMNWWDLKHLDAKGWEIADHTVSHVDLTTVSNNQLVYQLKESKKVFLEHGYNVVDFAAPYGSTNLQVQKVLQKYFVSNRAAWELDGIKINDANNLNRYNLTVVALNENTNIAEIKQLIYKADRYNKWLIFMVHNVEENCGNNKEYCISTEHLNVVAKFCYDNQVHVVTVKQFFDEHGE